MAQRTRFVWVTVPYRKAEQTQDERAKQHGPQQKDERVKRDAFRQKGTGWLIAAGRHSQENWSVAQWIYNRQQRANHQQDGPEELDEVRPDHQATLTWRVFPGDHRIHSAWPRAACLENPRRRAN